MVNLLRGAGQAQMRTPSLLATANAHALPASIAFEYPFATLRIRPYCPAIRRDLGFSPFRPGSISADYEVITASCHLGRAAQYL